MMADHISSALRRGLVGFLLMLAGLSLTGGPATAFNAYEPHHRDHGYRERNYQSPSYHQRYQGSIITIFTDIAIMSAAAAVWFLTGIPIGGSGASGLSVTAGRLLCDILLVLL